MFVEHTHSLVLMDFDTVRIIARPNPEMCNSTALAHQVWMRPTIDKNNLPRSPPNLGGVDDAVKVILRDCMNSKQTLDPSQSSKPFLPQHRYFATTDSGDEVEALSTMVFPNKSIALVSVTGGMSVLSMFPAFRRELLSATFFDAVDGSTDLAQLYLELIKMT